MCGCRSGRDQQLGKLRVRVRGGMRVRMRVQVRGWIPVWWHWQGLVMGRLVLELPL